MFLGKMWTFEKRPIIFFTGKAMAINLNMLYVGYI